jgi:hypothetical protein
MRSVAQGTDFEPQGIEADETFGIVLVIDLIGFKGGIIVAI